MPKRFLVFAPSYQPNSGGVVVLHKLCSILNDIGYDAYLLRLFNGYLINRRNITAPLYKVSKSIIKNWFLPYKLNPNLNTKVLKNPPRSFNADWIVVYPELIFDNPLGAKNVVRWMLYKPGFQNNFFHFGRNEYHIDFNNFVDDFVFPNEFRSSLKLYVLHFPFEHFNLNGALPSAQRFGTAYCLRKGKGRPIKHDLNNSILVDGMSHHQVAAILKRVKTFISYDLHTAYSLFAVLCGAESVVMPDENINKEQWRPDENERYGIAYGFDDLLWAHKTAHLVLDRMLEKEQMSEENVRHFAIEVLNHFSVTE